MVTSKMDQAMHRLDYLATTILIHSTTNMDFIDSLITKAISYNLTIQTTTTSSYTIQRPFNSIQSLIISSDPQKKSHLTSPYHSTNPTSYLSLTTNYQSEY